jgi:hypothetical protein
MKLTSILLGVLMGCDAVLGDKIVVAVRANERILSLHDDSLRTRI